MTKPENNSQTTRPPLPLNHPRLWGLRTASLLSILLLAWPLVEGFQRWNEPCEKPDLIPIFLLLAMLPYLIVLLLSFFARRGETLRPALHIAITWAVMMVFVTISSFQNLENGLALLAALLLGQMVLVIAAAVCFSLVREHTIQTRSSHGGTAFAIIWVVIVLAVPTTPLRTRIRVNEPSAVHFVRLLVNCAYQYQTSNQEKNFPANVIGMGPVSGGGEGCLDEVLTNAANGGPPKMGYTFTYTPGEPNEEGIIETFTVTAAPFRCGRTGTRTFFADESGVLRYTDEYRPATKDDPPLS